MKNCKGGLEMSNVFADLQRYAYELVSSGLVVGAGGNLSMRDGDYMYISPSGFDLKEIREEQWVKVNIETGEITRTFSIAINEHEYLFVDLSYDYLYEHKIFR